MSYLVARYKGEKDTYPYTELGYLKEVDWNKWYRVVDLGDCLDEEELNIMIVINENIKIKVCALDFDIQNTSGHDFNEIVKTMSLFDKRNLLKALVDSLNLDSEK